MTQVLEQILVGTLVARITCSVNSWHVLGLMSWHRPLSPTYNCHRDITSSHGSVHVPWSLAYISAATMLRTCRRGESVEQLVRLSPSHHVTTRPGKREGAFPLLNSARHTRAAAQQTSCHCTVDAVQPLDKQVSIVSLSVHNGGNDGQQLDVHGAVPRRATPVLHMNRVKPCAYVMYIQYGLQFTDMWNE